MKPLAWVLGVLVLTLALLVALPFSAVGTRLLVSIIDDLAPIDVEYRSGSLLGELELARVYIPLPAVSLELLEVHTQLRLECLWHSRFCFSRGDVGSVSVTVQPQEQSEEGEAGEASTLMEFAYPLQVDTLEIDQVVVAWEGGHWQQGRFSAGVEIESSRLRVSHALIDGAELRIDEADQAEEGYTGFAPPALFLPMALQVDSLDLADGRLSLGEQVTQVERLQAAALWRGDLLRLHGLSALLPGWGEVTALDGELHFSDAWPLDAQGTVVAESGRVAAPLDNRQWTVAVAGDFAALRLEVLTPGDPELTVQGELAVTDAGLPFTAEASLTWREPVALDTLLAGRGLPPDLRLAGPVHVNAAGDLLSQSLRVAGVVQGGGYESLQLRGTARWRAPQLVVESLELRDETSDSHLVLSGDVLLADAWRATAHLRSDGLQLPTLATGLAGRVGGELVLQAEGDDASWQVALSDLDVAGTINALPARVQGSVGLDHRLRLLPGTLEGDLNGTQLALRAAQEGDKFQLDLTLDSLGRWLPGAEGAVNVDVRGDLRGTGAIIRASVDNLHYATVEVPAAELTADWSGAERRLNANLSAAQMLVGDATFDLKAVQLSVAGTTEAHRLQLQSAGDIVTQLSLTGALADGNWQGLLQPATVATRGERWQLEAPVALRWPSATSTLEVDPHCWRHERFNLCGSQLLAGRTGNLQLSLDGDVRAFNGVLPRGLRVNGPLQASLTAEWGAQSPLTILAEGGGERIDVVRRYGMGERVKVTWDAARFRLAHEQGATHLTARAHREGRDVLVLEGFLPADRSGELQGRVVLDRLQLGTLSPWVTELSTLRGELSGELALAGTLADPKFSGELALREGHVVVVGNPTELTDLALALTLRDNRGTLSGSGLLGGGQVNLQGEIVTHPALRVTMQVSGTRHQILLPPASEMLVSEELQLVLSADLLETSGWVRVHEGVLRHEELPVGGVSRSRDVVMVDATGQVIQPSRPFEIRSEIVLRIDERFRVEGEQISATLGGDLQLVRELERPLQVFGTLRLLGGELNAYRQRLQIKRGTIAFSGPPDNPELNIAAEREIRADNVTVGARLFGRLEEPELEIYSNPVMSQSEAMSYLVRGRPLDSGANADGTALALSLGADAVNQSGIVRELNRLPLISNVAFGATGEADDTAATVSGYIGERIYLSYGVGIYEPINVLTARLYLQSRLWLEVVSRLENSVDLYYAFEIK